MQAKISFLLLLSAFLFSACVQSQDKFDTNNTTDVQDTAKIYANSIVNEFYKNNPQGSATGFFFSIPEELGGSQLTWSQSATLWDSLIASANLTGDVQFNDIVAEAIYAQVDENDAFMPANKTLTFGSANQTQWALTALSAHELGFPKPQEGKPPFLTLAKNMFDILVERWESDVCGGGLRDAIFPSIDDPEPKNSFVASGFFLLAARLNKATGNKTYADWAEKQFEWAQEVGLLSEDLEVVDQLDTQDPEQCKLLPEEGATNSNLGNWIEGSAVMANVTSGGNTTWTTRLDSLSKSTSQFLSNTNPPILDPPCRSSNSSVTSAECGIARTMQYTRSLSRAVTFAPSLSSTVSPLLDASAKSAQSFCGMANSQGGNSDKVFRFTAYCSGSWGVSNGPDDGSVVATGAALEAVQGLLWTTGGAQTQNPNSSSTQGGMPSPTTAASPSPSSDGSRSVSFGWGYGVAVGTIMLVWSLA